MAASEDERNRGRMKGSDYNIIQRNIPYLCKQLGGNDIVDNMFAKHILNRDDVVKVEKQMKEGRPEGIRVLLGFLMETGGVNAFDPFIECLHESGFGHVADWLKLERDRQGLAETMTVEETLSNAPSTPSQM